MSDQPTGEAGGMPDLNDLLSQAMQMQEQVMAAQAEAAEQVVEGVAGGGAVTIGVTGGGQFLSVRIAPEAVDPDDLEMLQDLVLAALNDAAARVTELQSQSLGGFGDLLGGGAIGGMLGLGGADEADESDDPDEA